MLLLLRWPLLFALVTGNLFSDQYSFKHFTSGDGSNSFTNLPSSFNFDPQAFAAQFQMQPHSFFSNSGNSQPSQSQQQSQQSSSFSSFPSQQQQQIQAAPVTAQPAVTAQIDQANLAKYSQYLDILQKAYGIQLPGELGQKPAPSFQQSSYPTATATSYQVNKREEAGANPYVSASAQQQQLPGQIPPGHTTYTNQVPPAPTYSSYPQPYSSNQQPAAQTYSQISPAAASQSYSVQAGSYSQQYGNGYPAGTYPTEQQTYAGQQQVATYAGQQTAGTYPSQQSSYPTQQQSSYGVQQPTYPGQQQQQLASSYGVQQQAQQVASSYGVQQPASSYASNPYPQTSGSYSGQQQVAATYGQQQLQGGYVQPAPQYPTQQQQTYQPYPQQPQQPYQPTVQPTQAPVQDIYSQQLPYGQQVQPQQPAPAPVQPYPTISGQSNYQTAAVNYNSYQGAQTVQPNPAVRPQPQVYPYHPGMTTGQPQPSYPGYEIAPSPAGYQTVMRPSYSTHVVYPPPPAPAPAGVLENSIVEGSIIGGEQGEDGFDSYGVHTAAPAPAQPAPVATRAPAPVTAPPPPPTRPSTQRPRPTAPQTRPSTRPTAPVTRPPPPPQTTAASKVPDVAAGTSVQALTQQVRKLPAVLYIDSRSDKAKGLEKMLRETYGLPLVSFYVDKVGRPKIVERHLQQLTAHKGLPYLFICGTFIGSEQHIDNYHKNGQIPQLVEYVCGDEKKKKKKTSKNKATSK